MGSGGGEKVNGSAGINSTAIVGAEEGSNCYEVVVEDCVRADIAGVCVVFKGEGKEAAGRGCEGRVVWEGEGECGHGCGSEEVRD